MLHSRIAMDGVWPMKLQRAGFGPLGTGVMQPWRRTGLGDGTLQRLVVTWAPLRSTAGEQVLC